MVTIENSSSLKPSNDFLGSFCELFPIRKKGDFFAFLQSLGNFSLGISEDSFGYDMGRSRFLLENICFYYDAIHNMIEDLDQKVLSEMNLEGISGEDRIKYLTLFSLDLEGLISASISDPSISSKFHDSYCFGPEYVSILGERISESSRLRNLTGFSGRSSGTFGREVLEVYEGLFDYSGITSRAYHFGRITPIEGLDYRGRRSVIYADIFSIKTEILKRWANAYLEES